MNRRNTCCFVAVVFVSTLYRGGFHQQVDAAPLLPDLIAWASEANNYMYGGEINASLVPGKTVYQFTGALPNIGTGPLEVRLEEMPNGSQNVFQRIHDSEGGTNEVLIDNFTDAASLSPRRLFLPGIARYNLRTVLSEDGLGPVVSTWDKTSMALVDGRKYEDPPAGTPPNAVYNSLQRRHPGGLARLGGHLRPQFARTVGGCDGARRRRVLARGDRRPRKSNPGVRRNEQRHADQSESFDPRADAVGRRLQSRRRGRCGGLHRMAERGSVPSSPWAPVPTEI